MIKFYVDRPLLREVCDIMGMISNHIDLSSHLAPQKVYN